MGQERKGRQNLKSIQEDHSMAILGHELGNVLNGLLGMSGLMRESNLSAEQDRWLRAIEHCGRQMSFLIDSFRDRGLGVGEEVKPRPRRIDGLRTLEQSIISHLPAAHANGNGLFLTVDPDLPRTWNCDPGLLGQLVDNLLGNAIKFTRSGQIVLKLATGGIELKPGALLLKIRDSGVGIEVADGGRIFEAYAQGRATIKDNKKGNGLGLFICHRIVEAMGGSISWSSPAGGGTRFEIELPGALFRDRPGMYPKSSIPSCMHCIIDLAQPLRESIANFLTRLGVGWDLSGAPATNLDDGAMQLLFSDAQSSVENPGPAVLMSPCTDSRQPAPRILCAPILESTLELALLEIGLEWKCRSASSHSE
jgi:hypothetical protein